MSDVGALDLLRLVGPERRRLTIACATAVLGTILGVVPFLLAALMVTAAAEGDVAMLWWLAGGAAVALLAQGPLMGLSTGIAHMGAFDLLFAIRQQLMSKLARLPLGYFTQAQTGALKRVLNEEVEALELFISHQLPDVVASIVTLVALLGVLMWVDWRLALAMACVLPLAYLAQILMMRGHSPNIQEYFGRIGKINAAAIEFVQGMDTLKTFRGGALVHDELRRQVQELYIFSETWRRGWMKPWVFYTVVTGAAPLFVLPLGLWLHQSGRIEPAALIFALFAATGFGVPLVKLTFYSEILLRVLQALKKIRGVLGTAELKTSAPAAAPIEGCEIVCDGITFRQGARTILDNVSLSLPAGGISAIVGPSGAGKTTLVRLLIRSGDLDAGRITIGDVDIGTLPPDHLARTIGLVAQDTFLFNDTIRENLRLAAPNATDDDVTRAAREAHCEAFIEALPQGYDTRVGEGGARLSGGQRQRLALARAFLAGTPILVLDEPTAFADPYHEALMQDAIGRVVGRKTVVIVTHRIDAVAACDHLVFLENGRVTASGTPAQLHGSCARYRALSDIQAVNLAWRLDTGAIRAEPPSAVMP